MKIQSVSGKQLQNIQVNGVNVNPDSLNLAQGVAIIIMNSNKQVNPIFDNTYTLTLQSANGETIKAYWKNSYAPEDEISTSQLTKILAGTTVYIKVTPPAGKVLESIKVNGTNVTFDATQGTTNIVMNSDKVITATLQNIYTLTLQPTNGETIKAYWKNSYAPEDEISTSQLTKILAGTTVYIKVTPPAGKVLESIKVNGTNVTFDATQGTTNIVMNSDKVITATLQNIYTLTLQPTNGETIKAYWKNSYAPEDEISTSQLTKILAGTTVYIKVTPPAGKVLESIKVNGTNVIFDATQGTTNIVMNSDKVITATFLTTYKLTLNSMIGTDPNRSTPAVIAYSDATHTTLIPDIDHILPGTIVYLKTYLVETLYCKL